MTSSSNVSIVIPTYNRAGYLDQCIQSALAQTVACEIVVCDHGSTDNTPEIAAKYGNKIKYVRRETDFGVHFCWLDGVLNASGAFIHINYDDDWIEPLFIEKCMALFDNETGFVFSDVTLFDEETQSFSEPTLKPFFKKTGWFHRRKLWFFELKNLISPGCAVFRKQVLLDQLYIGRIPFTVEEYKGVGPDLLFSLMSTLDRKKIGFVAEPLAIFRCHSNSITVNALQDVDRKRRIRAAYDEARVYFMISRFIKIFAVRRLFFFILNTTVALYDMLKRLKK